jgi:hypothetical protein
MNADVDPSHGVEQKETKVTKKSRVLAEFGSRGSIPT